MMHINLIAYYERIFAFQQFHHWSISEIESLMPWEFDAMTSMLSGYLEKVEMQRKQDFNSL
jgi:hypothetical protein